MPNLVAPQFLTHYFIILETKTLFSLKNLPLWSLLSSIIIIIIFHYSSYYYSWKLNLYIYPHCYCYHLSTIVMSVVMELVKELPLSFPYYLSIIHHITYDVTGHVTGQGPVNCQSMIHRMTEDITGQGFPLCSAHYLSINDVATQWSHD